MKNIHPVELQPIHRLFEQQAARVPDNPALLWAGERVSYAELNAMAEGVAGMLRESGVTPGSVVGIETDRCRELIPGLLGIFKAGCAYVPLLPSLPEERRAFMLADSGAVCKLTVDSGRWTVALCRGERCSSHAKPISADGQCPPLQSLAYILYTSGSTGKPKGVKITQEALCNRLLWHQAHFGLCENDVLLQKTSLGFDVSLWELFWAFTVGAALRVPEPGAEKDPRRLFELIARDNIKFIHFVPSMLTEFLEAYDIAGRPKLPLRNVIVSGEALTPALNRRFYELMGGFATLHNLYGPTECTVDVLYYDCKPEDEEIPIGKVVWNTGAYILDADGHEAAPGEQGELCISGIQLAAGYADSSLDAGRFVEHPALGRIYHTGDVASERADGEILYHGRRDGQVKIRGQRVELGEIESALGEIEEVRQAAVLWDGSRLDAYFLSALPLRGEYLRNRLAKTLPAYMLPDSFTRMDAFPLNASGKLDRRTLAQQSGGRREEEGIDLKAKRPASSFLPPESPAEHTLAAILEKHFGKDNVSMGDSPLSLGLDSLALVRLATLLGERGILVAVNDFFTAPSLRALVGLAKAGDTPALLKIAGGDEDCAEGTAFIGIPYGGGGFGVYSAIARELSTLNSQLSTAFYAVRNAHVETAELLTAVQALPQKRRVIIGSCVGAASALALAAGLEEADMPAEAVFLISGAPAVKYRKSPWRIWGDRTVNRYLAKLNGRRFGLSAHEMRSFRADTDYFFAWQRKPESPAHAPIFLLIGESDPMLKKLDVPAEWERLLGRGIDIQSLPGGLHYLPHTHAQAAAEWIVGKLR